MILNDALLYLQISALFSHHQTGFLMQQEGVGKKTYTQTLCRETI